MSDIADRIDTWCSEFPGDETEHPVVLLVEAEMELRRLQRELDVISARTRLNAPGRAQAVSGGVDGIDGLITACRGSHGPSRSCTCDDYTLSCRECCEEIDGGEGA